MSKEATMEKLREITDRLPLRPSKAAVDYVCEQLDLKDEIVYRVAYIEDPLTGLKKKMCKCTCTGCKRTFHEEYAEVLDGCHAGGYGRAIGFINHVTGRTVSSYSETECPECGAPAEAIHISKISRKGRYEVKHSWVGEIFNVGGAFAMLSWYYSKECDKEGVPYYVPHLSEGVLYYDGTLARVEGYQRVMMGAIMWRPKWQLRPMFNENFGKWQAEEMFYSREVIEQTHADRCGIADYIEQGGSNLKLGAYMYIYSKCPAIENLAKSGYARYITQLIEALTYTEAQYGGYVERERFKISELKKYINVKRAKPHEMLRVCKEDRFLWGKIGIERFAFFGYVHELYGIRLDSQRIEQCFNEGLGGWYAVLQKHKGFLPPLERTFNYLDREKHKHLAKALKAQKNKKGYLEHKSRAGLISPRYLYDYWKMVYDLHGGFPEELRYPRDLIAAHDEMSSRIRTRESEKLRTRFERRREALDYMAWVDDETGLLIRPAASQAELIAEGTTLHHCVASYAESHANGRTAIFFIRYIEKPDEPFFTLEYRGGVIAQDRGFKNLKDRHNTPIIARFEERWLAHLAEIKERGKNDGKRSRSKEEQRAGA